MKFALVNIPDNGISGKGYSIPLGLAYIGAIIRSKGHEVRGYDLSVSKDSLNKYYLKTDTTFLDTIKTYRPDVIGITCTTTNRINVEYWSGVFKNNISGVMIMVGGPHPYFIPEDYLRSNPNVDVLVLGEGEKTIADFLDAVSAGRDPLKIDGIAHRDANNAIGVNPENKVIHDLDTIIFPARDLFPMNEYDIKFGTISGKSATLITSRGCGSKCKFCSTTRYWQKVRFRSAKNIVDEIEHILKEFPFIENFVFFDDTFTSNRRHAFSVCDEIIRRNIKINWGCWSRTDIVDAEYFPKLKDAGCTTLSFGIESGNDQMLETLWKRSTVANNTIALTVPSQYGISTRGTMIAGMPEETFSWAIDSLLFMAQNQKKCKGLQISFKTFIFPGTYWEQWFKDKYRDFSWQNIPERFKKGSLLDAQGNIVLPCYRWKGFPYLCLTLLHKMLNYRLLRTIIGIRFVSNSIRKIVRCYPWQHPKSIYD
jgi:anaerobic magnesium-protoporphyrin IX monomethyl ester cyclase